MKANYDFSKARRGAVLPADGNKVRITIRLDRAIIDWFKAKVEAQGGGNYQTMLNDALHAFIGNQEKDLEAMLRRVVREEIKKASRIDRRIGLPRLTPEGAAGSPAPPGMRVRTGRFRSDAGDTVVR